ncbi:MAG: putative baseplate assembly protein, partial [Gammaproteobacteria bacterium]
VQPDSLRLTVSEGAIGGNGAGSTPEPWREVDDLDAYGPDDRVFELDEVSGELQFGDGAHGAALPRGFRHVVAEQYQIATGAAGAVDADQITTLLSSAPFLTGVSNTLPATGGRDAESVAAASQLGPQHIRARGHAVTTADYALHALSAEGADILRAHATGGSHAGFDGAQIPGTVSVYLVGPAKPDGPPYPDQGSLDAVARYLTAELAPAGVEVVAAAPYFHQVSIRATLVAMRDADAGNVLRGTLREIDSYLDPLVGGDDSQGWPFGGPIKYASLVRRLIARVPELIAVSALNLTVDGETLPACSDFAARPNSLLWPLPHELRLAEGDKS